jgi:hypothetical protein
MGKRALGLLVLSCAIAGSVGAGTSGAACPIDNPDCGTGGGPITTTISKKLTIEMPTQGTATSDDGFINCGATCSKTYTYDHTCDEGDCTDSGIDTLTLSATGGPSGYSPRWLTCSPTSVDGTCTPSTLCGTTTCQLEMTSNYRARLSWVDTTNPSVGLSSPPSKAGPDTVFNATASDNSGTVSKVDFYVDGILRATDTSAPFQWVGPDLSPYADGSTHTLKVISQDGSGRLSSDLAGAPSATFMVDKSTGFTGVSNVPSLVSAPPTIGFTPPGDMASVVCRTKLATTQVGSTSGCSSPYSPQGVSGDGNYTVEIQGTDNVGNSATVTRTFTLDTTPPSLTISSPSDGDVKTPGFTPNITATDAHGPTVQCKLDSASYGSCGPQSGSPGTHTFWARATDGAGNVTVKSVHFSFASTGSGSQQKGDSGGGSNVGASISDAVLASKIVSDLGSAARKLAKQKQHSLAKKGKYSLSIHALMAGKFTASFTGAAGKASASRATKIATGSKQAKGAGGYKLTLKLTKAGKKLLRKGKRVKGSLTVSFTKAGGGKVSRHKTVTLKRR